MSEFEGANYQVPSQGPEDNNMGNDQADDVLGLDQQIKLTKRSKVATLNQERVLGKTGLPYIVKSHQKVGRILKKNDKRKPKTKQDKYDHEDQNLASVLQFYQLWCHTLFPKANFKDCIQLLRGVGHRSKAVKVYRQELLERELYKMKIEKGIIDVPDPSYAIDVNGPEQEEVATEQGGENGYNDSDDDFAFMNRSNGLFVGNDEELYTTPPNEPEKENQPENQAQQDPVQISVPPHDFGASNPIQKPSLTQFSDDDFSDEETFLSTKAKPQEEIPENEEFEENHDEELDIMNELGM